MGKTVILDSKLFYKKGRRVSANAFQYEDIFVSKDGKFDNFGKFGSYTVLFVTFLEPVIKLVNT